MPKYLDENGLLYFWQKIKTVFSSKAEGVKSITRSGTTFTVTRADDTTFTFTQQDNTVAKTTTTPLANGTAFIGNETKYAAGDHVHPLQTSVSGNAGTATKLATGRSLDGVTFDGSQSVIHFGTSSTAAGTATKEVACPNYAQTTGAWICVKFSVTNTAAVSGLKLSVAGSTAAPIKYRGSNLPSAGTLTAGRVYLFVFDGTNYELIGDLDTNTTYTAASATPLMDGTGAVGTSAKYAREDHVHPSDTTKVDKETGKGLSSNDYTTTEKNKLAGIASGAEVNQNAFSSFIVGETTVAADGKTDSLTIEAGANVTIVGDASADKITISSTNTTYSDATTSASGLMSASDKTKLNGIATGAEVNQNAFSNVKVGTAIAAANAQTDTLTLAPGNNVNIAADTANNKITISATNTVTTAHTSGSGNAVTAISASNGSLTVTKGKTFIETSAKGAANGVCPLNANSVIDSQYLPSFVDDVVEAYPRSGQTELSSTWLAIGSASGTVITPQTGVIYVLMADSTTYGTNSQFRWSGTAYVKLNDGGVSSITNAEIDTILAA